MLDQLEASIRGGLGEGLTQLEEWLTFSPSDLVGEVLTQLGERKKRSGT